MDRLNLLYTLDTLCSYCKKKRVEEYLVLFRKSLLEIIKLTIPSDDVKAIANLSNVMKVKHKGEVGVGKEGEEGSVTKYTNHSLSHSLLSSRLFLIGDTGNYLALRSYGRLSHFLNPSKSTVRGGERENAQDKYSQQPPPPRSSSVLALGDSHQEQKMQFTKQEVMKRIEEDRERVKTKGVWQ